MNRRWVRMLLGMGYERYQRSIVGGKERKERKYLRSIVGGNEWNLITRFIGGKLLLAQMKTSTLNY